MAQRWSLVIHRNGWEGHEDALAELLGVYSTSTRAALHRALLAGQVVLKTAPSKEALQPLVDRLLPMGIEASMVDDAASDTEPATPSPSHEAAMASPTPDAHATHALPASEPDTPIPATEAPTGVTGWSAEGAERGSTGWGAVLGDAAPNKAPSLPPAGRAPASAALSSAPAVAPMATSHGEDMRRKLDALALPASARTSVEERAVGDARRAPSHIPALSVLASLVAPGCGQAINGEPSRGLLILLGSPLVLPWLYGVFEAGKHASDMREGRALMSAKRSPGAIAGFLAAGIALWVSAGVGFTWTAANAPDEPATSLVETPTQPPGSEEPALPEVSAPGATNPAQQQEDRRERRQRQQAVHQLLVQARNACNEGAGHQCLQLARHILSIDPVQREARTLEADALLILANEFGAPLEHDNEEGLDPSLDTTPPAEAPP